eukprot:TRINITY_DN6364_c0_g1_i1.p1 TRINITY_DN6364_c0_g1~~TRINITY_DN6364_c0_g1_i1.p1  ORF type:complete len:627 (+),score=163.35 TRINITY_DN6364_c0_g1_i1:113-1993(+)
MLGGLFDDSPSDSSKGGKGEAIEKPQKADSREFLLPYFADHSTTFVRLQVQTEANKRRLSSRTIPNNESAFNRRLFRTQTQTIERCESKNSFCNNFTRFSEVSGEPGGFTKFLASREGSKGTLYHFIEEGEPRSSLLSSKEEANLSRVELNYNEKIEQKFESCQLFVSSGWTQLALEEEAKYSSLSNDYATKFCSWNGGISLASKTLLVAQILLGFSTLSNGGNMVLLMSEKETLFVSSLLIFLWKNFESFKVWKDCCLEGEDYAEETPSTVFEAFRSGFFLCLSGFKPQNGSVEHLKKILERLKEGVDMKWIPSIGKELTDGDSDEEAKKFVVDHGEELTSLYEPLWTVQSTEMELLQTAKERKRKEKESKQPKNFKFLGTSDTNGVIYNCTQNDKIDLNVTSSGMKKGSEKDFLLREKAECYTTNRPYSWFCVDLGESAQLIPTHYTMGYANSSTSCSPKKWILQGGNTAPNGEEYSKTNLPDKDPNWTTLSIHENDPSLSYEWAVHSWRVQSKSSFRFFRVVQMGANGNSNDSANDNWSNVFVVNRFEIYGTILSQSVGNATGVVTPKTYGVDPNAYVQPEWIRADNPLQREVIEILEYFIQQAHGQVRTENVTVHDIMSESW